MLLSLITVLATACTKRGNTNETIPSENEPTVATSVNQSINSDGTTTKEVPLKDDMEGETETDSIQSGVSDKKENETNPTEPQDISEQTENDGNSSENAGGGNEFESGVTREEDM